MVFYLVLFMFVYTVSFLDLTDMHRHRRTFIAVVLVEILIFLSGIRWIGTDWEMYYGFFDRNNTLSQFINSEENIDIGFGFVNFIVKFFTNEYTFLLFTVAFLIMSLKLRFILHYSKLPLMTLLVSFSTYIGDIFFVRQVLAIAITLVAFDFIVKKNFWRFFVTVITASLVHVTAIIFLPAYFIFYMKVNRKILISLILIGIYLQLNDCGVTILQYTVDSLGWMPMDLRLSSKIYEYYARGVDNETWAAAAYIRRLIFIPVEIYMLNKFTAIDQQFSGYIKLIIFGYFFFFTFSGISLDLALRGSAYYYVYEIIVIPYIVMLFKNLWIKISAFVVISFYCFLKYQYAIHRYYDIYVPFETILKHF